MKIVSSIQVNIYEGTTNEKEVVDRLASFNDTSLTAHKELVTPVAASTTDQAIDLTGLTPTKYVQIASDVDITVKFAVGGTAFVGKQFSLQCPVTTILVSTTTAAVVTVIVAK